MPLSILSKLEMTELKAINATADERIARLTSIIKMLEPARYGHDEHYGFVFDEVEIGLSPRSRPARTRSKARAEPPVRRGREKALPRISSGSRW